MPVIPQLLHRVVSQDGASTDAADRWQRFADLHPDWNLVDWPVSVDPADFQLGRLFASCRSDRERADLIRLEVLWRDGGIVVGDDVEPLSSLKPLLEFGLFACTFDGRNISTTLTGAEPGHPGVRALMDRLLEFDEIPADLAESAATGGDLWTRTFEQRHDIVVLPPELVARPERAHPVPGRALVALASDQGVAGAAHTALLARKRTWLIRKMRTAARRVVAPALRGVGRRMLDGTSPMRGVYVGGNRVLISTLDGSKLHAIANDLSLTPDLLRHGHHDDGLRIFIDRMLRPGDWFVDVGAPTSVCSPSPPRGASGVGAA